MDSAGIGRRAWVVALLVAGALWVGDAMVRSGILAAASSYGDLAPPARDAASVTGWKHGQRVQLHASADSYHWTMQAQQAAAEGRARVRHVAYDNAPSGREVHWSSPPRWWLGLVARIDRVLRGGSVGESIERAAIYAAPVMLLVLLVAGTATVARLFDGRAAAIFALGGVCIAPISSAFGVGNIDHHGLAIFCAMGVTLGLAAGMRNEAHARRGFVFSGVAGGVGLWISASTLVPVLVAAGCAAVVGAWISRGPVAKVLVSPWRVWGRAGGAVSIAAYLLEYFPSEMGWRLEVNHPLYALAWMGAAELIARVHDWSGGEELVGRGRKRVFFALATVAVAVLPAVIGFAGPATFVVSDRMLWLLHADYIEEFAALAGEFAGERVLPWWAILLLVVNIVPLLGIALVGKVLRPGEAVRDRLTLLVVGVPGVVALGMTLAQKRWLHLSGALWLAALVGYAAIAWPATKGRRALWVAFLIAGLGPYPIEVVRQASAAARTGPEIGPAEMREIAARDVAGWLRRREGGHEAIVLSDPTTTTQLIYFGGFRGVATLYWENLEGIRSAMEVAGTEAVDEARRIFDNRGIRYLVVASWQPYADEAARLVRGLRATEEPPSSAFLKMVEAGALPVWLRPLPYRLPPHPYFAQRYVAVFEYAPGQSPAEALVHQARYLLANQDEVAALNLLAGVLAREPEYLPALATQAQIYLRRREVGPLDRTWRQLLRVRAKGGQVAAEDRAVIATCFAAAGRRDDLRAELAGFWDQADEVSIRRMAPAGLAAMCDLSRRNDVSIPHHFTDLLNELVSGRR